MEAVWSLVVLALFGTYAVVNGFDLGSGLIYLFAARTDSDRRLLMKSSENSAVGLILAGIAATGALSAVLPVGFVFAAALLVALCILRRLCAILHNRVAALAFGWATFAAMVAFGLVIGKIVASSPAIRGTPAASWIPLLCTFCTMSILTLYSASWVAMNSTGELQERCRHLASGMWWAVLGSYVTLASAVIAVGPDVLGSLLQDSWMCGVAVAALAGLIGSRLCLGIGFDLGVVASAVCIAASLLASATAGPFSTLTVTAPFSLSAALLWSMLALSLMAAYKAGMHRRARSRMPAGHNHQVLRGR